MSDTSEKRYWAFISYSSKDRRWGQWLHKRLENYPIPKEFQGLRLFDGAVLGRNLRPVFRDRDELSGSSNLGPAILESLRQSRFLIVLCSPHSASSPWVNKEIEDFKAAHGDGNILALILDGVPNATTNPDHEDPLECFPPALRYPAEPLAGDLRKEGDGKERGFLKILSGISQLDFDLLYRRHERAQRARRLISSTVAALIIACLTALSIFSFSQWSLARKKTKEVESKNREQSLLLDDIALADHDSALQAFEWRNYRESAAYYSRSLSIRPFDNTVARSAVSTCILSDTLFAKQRIITRLNGSVSELYIAQDGQRLMVKTSGGDYEMNFLDGKPITASSDENWIPLVSSGTHNVRTSLPWLQTAIPDSSTLAASPDGSSVFVGTSSGKIHKINLASRENVWAGQPPQRKNHISQISISPCGQTLAVTDWDSSLSLIDSNTGARVDSITVPHNIEHLAFTPDGCFLVAASRDGYIRVFDTGSSPLLLKSRAAGIKTSDTDPPPFTFSYDPSDQLTVTESESGSIIASAIDLPQAASIHALSLDRRLLVSGTDNGRVFIVDLDKGSLLERNMTDKVTDLEISKDGGTCFVSSLDRNLVAIDLETGSECWRHTFKGFVNSVTLSHDGSLVAAASDDFSFKVFDSESGRIVWTTLTDTELEEIQFDRTHTLHIYSATDHYELDCSHLDTSLTNAERELSSFLQTHAASELHQISATQTHQQDDSISDLTKILEWKTAPPLEKTRSPFSRQTVRQLAGLGLMSGKPEGLETYCRLAPWHPLTPVSLARIPGYATTSQHTKYLCALTLERLKDADQTLWGTQALTEDSAHAASLMLKLDQPALAREAALLSLRLSPGHPKSLLILEPPTK